MDLGLSALALSFGAGLASVASPCVLPVVPIIVTGTADEHRSRPALVVAGIALSFIAMGVASSLFGGAIGHALPLLEKGVGGVVLAFGLLLLADVNLFKRLTFLQRIQVVGAGPWSGLLLGASLGLVWIPCVGPMLSSVLAMVATRGSLAAGVLLLFAYSLGFAVPMLAVGYGSQALRQRVRAVAAHPVAVRWVSGLLLVAFGVLILRKGMLFAGM
ncbi:MAG TPA: cytochrome c biogenesis CcdA family protein [Anaeromyxobacteraceae bacterium]|nr:cytochrome c biogenesis CcdA family protein [Anaeromyxobacteraceae bacterium]